MAIINRSKGESEQKIAWQQVLAPTITSATYVLATMPWPGYLSGAVEVSLGLSGSPNHSLWVTRFNSGTTNTGVTTFNVGTSMVVTAYGTSGYMGFSVVSGFSYPLLAGDVISLSTAAANTATANTTVTLVIRATQDIKNFFGGTA